MSGPPPRPPALPPPTPRPTPLPPPPTSPEGGRWPTSTGRPRGPSGGTCILSALPSTALSPKDRSGRALRCNTQLRGSEGSRAQWGERGWGLGRRRQGGRGRVSPSRRSRRRSQHCTSRSGGGGMPQNRAGRAPDRARGYGRSEGGAARSGGRSPWVSGDGGLSGRVARGGTDFFLAFASVATTKRILKCELPSNLSMVRFERHCTTASNRWQQRRPGAGGAADPESEPTGPANGGGGGFSCHAPWYVRAAFFLLVETRETAHCDSTSRDAARVLLPPRCPTLTPCVSNTRRVVGVIWRRGLDVVAARVFVVVKGEAAPRCAPSPASGRGPDWWGGNRQEHRRGRDDDAGRARALR